MSRQSEAERILELALERGALQYGEFKLSAGGTTSYYFDGRLVTLDPEGAYLVAKALLPLLVECGAQAIGGPTLGADPIVSAVAAVSFQQGQPIAGLIVRDGTKGHGGRRRIEGPLVRGSTVAVVDDTCTTGASVLRAIDALKAEGCRIAKVLFILDRREGGGDELRRRGYDFVALLEADGEGRVRVAGP